MSGGTSCGQAAVKANVSANGRKSNQNIQVYLRVRPTNDRERGIRSMEMVEVPTPREIVVKQTFESKMSKKFTFDRTFGPESRQVDVYQAVVAPLIEEVLAGYNCTVFAYGQTGTGKTHTMVGGETPTMVSSWEDESQLGIIPRSLSHLFQELRLAGGEFSMRVSYLELYNEELCDLLSASETTQIRIFDDANKKGSIIVQGLEEIPVHTTGDVYKLLAKGQDKRRMASTLMNAQSSRSHTIFSITVHIRENGIDGEELVKIGKLNLVDLAGSENLSKAGNEKGIRTRETVNINQSLLTLGRVITALVERTPHIPYRESKLTRLLQESLGGRTKTSIIATVSPGHKDLEETLSTLEYAHRAKNIQNRPEVNQKLSKKTVLKEYTEEIDRLKRDLMASRDKSGIYLAEETYNEMTFQLDSQNKDLSEKVALIKALKEDLNSKQRIFNEISLSLVEKASELESAQGRLAETVDELDVTKSVLRTTKRRYQEKKHLLETHVRTEEQLIGQATALIDVVGEASSDTYRLQDTIERRRDVDERIRSATETHARTMDGELQRFDELFEQAAKKCHNQGRVQSDELGSMCSANERFAEEAARQIAGLGEADERCAEAMVGRVRSAADELLAADKAHREQTRLADGAEQRAVGEQLAACDAQLGRIREASALQQANNDEQSGKLIDMTTCLASDATSFCQQRCSDARQLMPLVRQLIERNAAGNAALRSEIALNATRLVQVQHVFDEIRASNAAHSVQLDANATAMAELLEQLERDHRHGLASTEQFAGAASTACEQQCVALRTQCTDAAAAAHRTDELVGEQLAANALDAQRNDRQLAERLARLAEQERQLTDRVTDLRNEIEALQTARTGEMATQCSGLVADVQSESQRQRQSSHVCRSLNDALQRDLAEYGLRVAEQVKAGRERIARFHRTELQTYRSTGETPVKREFVYSKQLAQTSPHERLVRRFWSANEAHGVEALDCSTVTICEGNESAFLDGITDEKSSSILVGRSGDVPAVLLDVRALQPIVENRRSGLPNADDHDDDGDDGVQRLKATSSPKGGRKSRKLSSGSCSPSGGSVRSVSASRKASPSRRSADRLNRSADNKENVR